MEMNSHEIALLLCLKAMSEFLLKLSKNRTKRAPSSSYISCIFPFSVLERCQGGCSCLKEDAGISFKWRNALFRRVHAGVRSKEAADLNIL